MFTTDIRLSIQLYNFDTEKLNLLNFMKPGNDHLNHNDISLLRLVNQQIAEPNFKKVKGVVHWMGAMQAQDYLMAKWAVGVRLPASKDKAINDAINKAEIIRTHILRPTWHFVSSKDIYWMLELTAPHLKSGMRSRHKELEITDAVVKKSNAIIEKALANGNHLTGEELMAKLEKAKISTKNQRGVHILYCAELDQLICSGAIRERKRTYALLAERVAKKKTLKRDEALVELAGRYFTSHGPATLQDFIWWSGLPVADARKALEMVKSHFVSENIDSQTYWLRNSALPKIDSETAYLLPAYDEFLISYKDRSASLPDNGKVKTISINGIFRPVIVVNGQVIGIWKRTMKKDKAIIETNFFKVPPKKTKDLIEEAADSYLHFLNQK